MADSSEGNPSIDNGRSLFFKWLWLPIFSMCGRRVGPKELVSAKCNGSIDKQPEGGSLNDDAKSDATLGYAPPTVEGDCAGIANEERIGSSSDQLQLNNLPLPPLLEICKYLRADCKSLNNFRKTCRATAHAVNVFLEKQANLPEISGLWVAISEDKISLSFTLTLDKYFMHPIYAFNGGSHAHIYRKCSAWVNINLDIENDEAIQETAQYLRGPVDDLLLNFLEKSNDVEKTMKLLQNITIKGIDLQGRLTREVGSLALHFLRNQCQTECKPTVFIASAYCVPSIFSPAFITELDSLVVSVKVDDLLHHFPGLSNEFWQQFLMRKLREGCKIRIWPYRFDQSYGRFTADTNLMSPNFPLTEDSPDRNPSIDNGRSLFINWLWQPIVSMCGRRVEQKEMVSAKCNGLIDKQPEGGSLNDDAKSDATVGYAPPTVEEDCAGVDREERIDSSSDQVKLNDLPLPTLLEICKFLRADCKSLNNFRKTCRATAHAVNVFLEKKDNLPEISHLWVAISEHEISLSFTLMLDKYFMHPICAFSDGIHANKTYHQYQYAAWVTFSIDIENDEAIEEAAQYLRGPVENLRLNFMEKSNDVDKTMKLLQNITIKGISIQGRLTREVGSLTLYIMRNQRQPACKLTVFIASFRVNSIFSPTFMTELDSMAKAVKMADSDCFPGLSNAFWQQFLLQKLHEGCKVTVRYNRFTEDSDLTSPRIPINRVEWWRRR